VQHTQLHLQSCNSIFAQIAVLQIKKLNLPPLLLQIDIHPK
jgi:hypothetical protein